MKKLITLALVLVMVIAICPLVVSAETVTWDRCANSFVNVTDEDGATTTYLDILLNTKKKADAAGIPAIAEELFANKANYTWKLTITDVTAIGAAPVEKSFAPTVYAMVSNGVNEYPTFRFAICEEEDPFLPIKEHAYKCELSIYSGEDLLYSTGDSMAQTTCTVDPSYPDAKVINMAPFADGWENWSGGSNGNATQLLLMITNTADVTIADLWGKKDGLDWALDISTITVNEEGVEVLSSTRTIKLKPSSEYNGAAADEGGWGIIRFETCEEPDPNKFIPAKGTTYHVSLTVSSNGIPKYAGESGGFYCPMVPVMFNADKGVVEERDTRSVEGYEDLGIAQCNKGFMKVAGVNYYAPDWVSYKRSEKAYLYVNLTTVFDTELLLAKLESGVYTLIVTLTDADGKATEYPAKIVGYDDGEGEYDLHQMKVYLDLDGFTSDAGKLYSLSAAVKEGETTVYTGSCDFLSYGYISSDKKTTAGDNTYNSFEGDKVTVAAYNEKKPVEVMNDQLVLNVLLSKEDLDASGAGYTFKLYSRKADSVEMWKVSALSSATSFAGEGQNMIYQMLVEEITKDWESGVEYEVVVAIFKEEKAVAWGNLFTVCTEESYKEISTFTGSQGDQPSEPTDPIDDPTPPSGDSVVYLTVAAAVALVGMAIVIVKARKA